MKEIFTDKMKDLKAKNNRFTTTLSNISEDEYERRNDSYLKYSLQNTQNTGRKKQMDYRISDSSSLMIKPS